MNKVAVAIMGGALILAPVLSAAPKDKHYDPYMQGPADESKIIKEVRHHLLNLSRYTVFDDIGFRVNGGAVELTGQVTQPVLRDDAQNAVKGVEGVTNVINDIEVLPLSPNDNQIRRAEYRAIYGDPQIGDRYGYSAVSSIHIIVKNGNVRLEGVVANQMDKTLINLRANGVPGVFKVENDLQAEKQ